MLSIGSTATLAPMKPILAVGLMARIMRRGLAVRLEAGRRGVDDDQLMRLHIFLDVLEGQIVRRRVDQLASPAPSRRPGPARWETRSSSLRASSGSARRRRRHSRQRTEPGGKAISSLQQPQPIQTVNMDAAAARPKGGLPRQCTVSPNSDATNTAKLSRSRTATARAGPAWVPKIPSMRYFRNSRAPSAIASTARLAGLKIQQNRAPSARRRKRKGDDAAEMAQRD